MPPKAKGKRKTEEEKPQEDKKEADDVRDEKNDEKEEKSEQKKLAPADKKAKTDNTQNLDKGDVHITSSKACQAFAKRHAELEALIKKAKPGTKVTIDVQPKLGSKPDKGSFIVEVNGKKIVELIAMPRPFDKMKALSMETVANDVVKNL